MTTRPRKSAIFFFAGILIWIATAVFLEALGRAMEGMTGSSPTGVVASPASLLIIAYFVFSALIVLCVPSRGWRCRLALLVHVLLIRSILADLRPILLDQHRPMREKTERVLTLAVIYLIYFSPWIIAWTIALRRQQMPPSNGT